MLQKPLIIDSVKEYHKALLILVIALCFLGGCAPVREMSMIHPYREGKPFEECGVELKAYKSVQTRGGPQDSELAVAVAISGGGFRAANFGAGVLLALEQITKEDSNYPNVLSEVDYFSTASGGGFAVAAYISSLYDHLQFKQTYEDYSFAKVLGFGDSNSYVSDCPCTSMPSEEQLTDPCIKRHLQGFYPDFFNDFLKDLFALLTLDMFEKGGLYEQTIDDDILGYQWRKVRLQSQGDTEGTARSLNLGNIFVGKEDIDKPVRLPYWVANATVYNNGAIFAFAPEHLKLYKIIGYRHRSVQYDFLPNKPGYKEYLFNVPLAVGATASASFPGATYPTTLVNEMDTKNHYLHLQDGGVADNLAVITAVRLLADANGEKLTKKLLIVIDAYEGYFSPFSNTSHPPSIGKTAIRAMLISLDSWRGRYREIIKSLCRENDILPVFLSFDDVAELEDCTALFEFGLDENDVKSLTAEKAMDAVPFNLLRSISTLKIKDKGKLSKAEQNLLLAAGRYVVDKKKEDIRQKLSWQQPQE